jgi:hypothetical protein
MVREVLGIVFGIRCRLDQQKTGAISFSRRGFGNSEMISRENLCDRVKKTAPGAWIFGWVDGRIRFHWGA